jgi:cell division protein FtsZ
MPSWTVDFPPQAQRQIQAQNKIGEIAEQAQQRRRGLFERIASGLSRKEAGEPETAVSKEPVITTKPAQRVKPHAAEENKAQSASGLSTPQIDPTLDDDQLEIPAFLRRQAN